MFYYWYIWQVKIHREIKNNKYPVFKITNQINANQMFKIMTICDIAKKM